MATLDADVPNLSSDRRRSRGDGRSAAYSAQIAASDLLTAEEEIALARGVEAGDRAARDRLVTANLRLVIKIAAHYNGRGLALDDLIGEGNLGLLRAAEDFDPAFGVRFGTYAVYWIKQAIRHALSSTAGTIRVPAHAADLLAKWRRAERSLAESLGEPPTPEQVAAVLGLSPMQRSMVEMAIRARGLARLERGRHEPGAGREPADPRGDTPEATIHQRETAAVVRSRLERLDGRERAVLMLRFGLTGDGQMSLKEAGRRLGITREWARILQHRALRKLADDFDAGKHGKAIRPAGVRRRPADRAQRRRRPPIGIVPAEEATLATVSGPPVVASLAASANR